jgi:hypothetical protein
VGEKKLGVAPAERNKSAERAWRVAGVGVRVAMGRKSSLIEDKGKPGPLPGGRAMPLGPTDDGYVSPRSFNVTAEVVAARRAEVGELEDEMQGYGDPEDKRVTFRMFRVPEEEDWRMRDARSPHSAASEDYAEEGFESDEGGPPGESPEPRIQPRGLGRRPESAKVRRKFRKTGFVYDGEDEEEEGGGEGQDEEWG